MDEIAKKCVLHRNWTFYVKLNNDSWVKEKINFMYKITNVHEMWQILQNVPICLTGRANIFFMEENLLPLWETETELWENGGCWSIIVKHVDWVQSMREIVLDVFGEIHFDDRVKGICVVPVAAEHCILKLWTTTKDESIAEKMQSLTNHRQCDARFKSFC